MEHSIRFKTEQLNATLIDALKKCFRAIKTKEVVISFSSPSNNFSREETMAETKARIEKAIENAESGKGNWIPFTGEEFEELSKALLRMNTD